MPFQPWIAATHRDPPTRLADGLELESAPVGVGQAFVPAAARWAAPTCAPERLFMAERNFCLTGRSIGSPAPEL